MSILIFIHLKVLLPLIVAFPNSYFWLTLEVIVLLLPAGTLYFYFFKIIIGKSLKNLWNSWG